MRLAIGFFCVAVLVGVQGVRADKITLSSGTVIDCIVLSETPERITYHKGSSTFSLPRDQVLEVKRDPAVAAKPTIAADRLPSMDEVVLLLSKQDWAATLEQIPATVIDKGILKRVPYASHRAGDYEINVYGNPESPACVEIGIYRTLLKDPKAQQNCFAFISTLLDPQRAAVLAKLNRAKDSGKLGEWTIEITAPTDEDAYGGWWISVYSEAALDKSRASAEEMKAITVTRASVAPVPAGPDNEKVAVTGDGPRDTWSSSDLSRSRAPSSGEASSGGGSVYVKGYTRKDGTYVHSYTRSAPGSRGGRK
jgi:hypothetical protein